MTKLKLNIAKSKLSWEDKNTNRICDNGGGMYIAPIKYSPYFSVDSPSDLKLVNRAISKDTLWKKYK